MQLSITIEELMKLQESLSQKDIEIALLRKELEELRNKVGAAGEVTDDSNFLTFKLDNICKVFEELKGNANHVAFLFFVLLRMMPEGMSPAVVQRLMAAASLGSLPINLMAKGDINIDGNYNNIHGNDNVNL